MARPNPTAQQRNLSLTEELERLEQSITLTLQEIDQNFSIAHRIVTSSILPIVDQYATHSRAVWEGSKFWKQFFESSANVSLSGYEEGEQSSNLHSNVEESVTEEETNTTATQTTLSTDDQSYETPSQQHIHTDSIQDLDLSNLSISPSHSTPRPSKKQQPPQPHYADYPSPYEALRAEVNNTTNFDTTSTPQPNPTTPGRHHQDLTEISHPSDSSSLIPHHQPPPSTRPSTTRKRTDPLLHHVLDKTYRIQATPLTTTRHRNFKPQTPATTTRNPLLDSPQSSPEIAPPQLHAEIFSSPERRRRPSPSKPNRTPGISVLTPARARFPDPTHHQTTTPRTRTRTGAGTEAWDSDEDSTFEQTTISPPKTMQFHIPQSRLLKTPAKEASRQIVDDVLAAAGVHTGQDHTDELDDFEISLDATNYDDMDDDGFELGDVEENSPSVVRRAVGLDDEVF